MYAVELHEDSDLSVRVVVTRGVGGEPTSWVYAFTAPGYSLAQREGIRVVTLNRGYRSDVGRTSPWLIIGAKTLS
ncbi:hypothetical protein ACFVX3_20010 [Rhodococcus erythropolis]